MFHPYYGLCIGKGAYKGCNKRGLIATNSRRLCQKCESIRKAAAPIRRITEKKKMEIKASNKYYADTIAKNMKRNNGTCLCDNCNEKINDPLNAKGSIVCHILSSGANKALYLNPLNSWILGRGELFRECNCKWQFDESRKREDMNIYRETQARIIALNAHYYKSKRLKTI